MTLGHGTVDHKDGFIIILNWNLNSINNLGLGKNNKHVIAWCNVTHVIVVFIYTHSIYLKMM